MTTNDWSAQLTARVAEQIRAARRAAGLTVAQTADACLALGVPVQKTTITNLETGRRTSVDLAELLALAQALGVPPITLLFPLGATATVELLPGRPVPTWEALAWFTGEASADGAAAEGSPQHVLDTFRAHSDAVAAASVSARLAKERRRAAITVQDASRRVALLDAASSFEELAAQDCKELRGFRRQMEALGLVPPPLPEPLAFVDDMTDDAGEDA